MQRTTLFVAIDLQSTAEPIQQRSASFEALRVMLKMFRRVPFATNGSHDEIFIANIRQVEARETREAPD